VECVIAVVCRLGGRNGRAFLVGEEGIEGASERLVVRQAGEALQGSCCRT
jgi:hypothetical protein